MRQEKQYAVEVIERHQHGMHGKEMYFGLYVPGFNKSDAEEVAMETIAAMTFGEINSRCIKQGDFCHPWHVWDQPRIGTDTPIGFDMAEKYFTCKAYIE